MERDDVESTDLAQDKFQRVPVATSCEHDNEPSGSITGKTFFYWLGEY
jgi:hypothetical protein